MKCRYCLQSNHETAEACPRVRSIEYCYDGRIKRVEFSGPPPLEQGARTGTTGFVEVAGGLPKMVG